MAVTIDEQMERELREVYDGPEEDFWPLVSAWMEDGNSPYFDRWLEKQREVHQRL